MTGVTRVSDRWTSSAGFTLVELMVYMLISVIVMGAVYNVLISQSRQHALHIEIMDARETLRGAGALLMSELRPVSAKGGDLYQINASSIALRSVQGTGIVCTRHNTLPRFGLWRTAGDITATADDSALVFAAGRTSTGDDVWNRLKIAAIGSAAALGVGNCDWPGGANADLAVQLEALDPPIGTIGDTAGIAVGAPFRAFRRAEYGIFQRDGHWWLGRKLGSAVSWELVTGPLRSPADSGLVFHYYDATNAETTVRTNVVLVEIVLRSESTKMARSSGGLMARYDSLRVMAFLRN